MKHLDQDLFTDETLSEDEFDQLCSELLYVEPPTTLLTNILDAVAQLHSDEQPLANRHAEKCTVYHSDLQPS